MRRPKSTIIRRLMRRTIRPLNKASISSIKICSLWSKKVIITTSRNKVFKWSNLRNCISFMISTQISILGRIRRASKVWVWESRLWTILATRLCIWMLVQHQISNPDFKVDLPLLQNSNYCSVTTENKGANTVLIKEKNHRLNRIWKLAGLLFQTMKTLTPKKWYKLIKANFKHWLVSWTIWPMPIHSWVIGWRLLNQVIHHKSILWWPKSNSYKIKYRHFWSKTSNYQNSHPSTKTSSNPSITGTGPHFHQHRSSATSTNSRKNIKLWDSWMPLINQSVYLQTWIVIKTIKILTH